MTFALIYALFFCPASAGIGYCAASLYRSYQEQFED